MPRNPHATNLRHHKPKRIGDKRDKLLGKFYADPDEWGEWLEEWNAWADECYGPFTPISPPGW